MQELLIDLEYFEERFKKQKNWEGISKVNLRENCHPNGSHGHANKNLFKDNISNGNKNKYHRG